MGATPNLGAARAQTHAGNNGAQVEKTGGQRGNKKLSLAVEDSHGQGRQGHQDKEGKHDPGHQGGEFQLPRDRAEIRGHDPHDIRGEPHAHHDQQAQEQGEAKDHVIGQLPGLLRPQTLVIIGENRDESGAQGPFGKQVTEQVGNPEGNDEGVKSIARAKKSGKDLFPHQPQNPAGKDRNADRPCGPGDGSRFGWLSPGARVTPKGGGAAAAAGAASRP